MSVDVRGYLVVPSQVSPEMEDEFNEWYDTEHVPERQRIEGFLSWRRFRAVHGLEPRYLALYDLASPEVLESPAYTWLRSGGRTAWATRILEHVTLTRYVCRAVDVVDHEALTLTSHVLAVIGQATADAASAFAAWFDGVHAPAMRSVPGIRMVRRFESLPAHSPPALIAVYELEGPEVCETTAYLGQLEATGAWRFFHHLTRSLSGVWEQIDPSRGSAGARGHGATTRWS